MTEFILGFFQTLRQLQPQRLLFAATDIQLRLLEQQRRKRRLVLGFIDLGRGQPGFDLRLLLMQTAQFPLCSLDLAPQWLDPIALVCFLALALLAARRCVTPRPGF